MQRETVGGIHSWASAGESESADRVNTREKSEEKQRDLKQFWGLFWVTAALGLFGFGNN